MKYAVVSYWSKEADSAKMWLYNSQEEARKGLYKLWRQSVGFALEDEDFDKENSYLDCDFAVVAWGDELRRYFEVVKQSIIEEI